MAKWTAVAAAAVAAVAAALASSTGGVKASDDHVVVLTDDSFDDAVKNGEFVLAEFYAPWCGHCKALEPEYKKAAAELQSYSPKVTLAKIDATVEKKLAERFGIQGFPTLKWFVNGKDSEYGGGRTADAIVSWVKKKTGPACKTLASVADVDAFKASADVVVVGAFGTKEAAKAFESAAQADDDTQYGLVIAPSADVAKALGVDAGKDAVVLFKKFDEGRAQLTKGSVSEQEDIAKFVSGNELPLITAFSQQTAPKIFGGSVKRHVILFVDASDDSATAAYKAAAKPVAEEERGEYLFVTIDKSDSRVVEFFGVTNFPDVRVVELNPTGIKKFKLVSGGEMTTDALRETVKKHRAGELKPDLKSEEPPASNDGPVKIVTGKTFQSFRDKGDMFIAMTASWCGHCKALAPKWEELGQKYQNNPKVTIAKMDATLNEVEGVEVQGFPTIKLFKANGEVVDYDGAREVSDFVSFLDKHVAACEGDSCAAAA